MSEHERWTPCTKVIMRTPLTKGIRSGTLRAAGFSLGSSLLFLVLLVFFFWQTKSFLIVPISARNAVVTVNLDTAESGGNSEINVVSKPDQSFAMTYCLHKGFRYPYAGIVVSPKDSSIFFDLNSRSRITADLETPQPLSITVSVDTRHHGNKTMPLLHEKRIDLPAGRHSIVIDRSSLATPSWWFEEHDCSQANPPQTNWAQTENIVIESGSYDSVDVRRTLIIHSLKLERNMRAIVLKLMTLFLVLSSLLVVVFLFIQRKSSTILIPVPADLSSHDDPVMQFLTHDFADPELSPALVAKKLGISITAVNDAVHRAGSINFSACLAKIRVAEASRILIETDRPINDIARRVGFTSATAFNDTLKRLTGKTPGEFRRDNKGGSTTNE